MQAATLKKLDAAAIPPRQARAIGECIDDEVPVHTEKHATREQLSALGATLRAEIQAVRTDMQTMRGDLITAMGAMIGGTVLYLTGLLYFLFGRQ